ncbi:DUF2953 domain-containing protein [Rhodoferax ferrireducens]|uniref:DUF2953 domain-containing protein n=1 Tax=Rhodoferax ferrireducens TaxID=192843 RepID=UPI00298E8257|nr:DUF2953 domain-containing protein [Rhodoferax ferrireducens]WPC67072.1 DUF2953 domain-containing protein [Rhodoferax ferrireducens]
MPVILAIIVGLPLLLLALPIDVAFRVEGIETFNGQIAIRWMFGLVRFRARIPGLSKPAREPQAAKVRVKPDKRSSRPNVLALLRQAAFRRRVYRLATDLVRAAHLHRLHLRMRLGLGDPADTGRLWALVGPLNAVAQNLRNADVRIEAEYLDPVFEFQARGRLLLVPLQFLILAIGFALSPASIRAWRTLKGRHA